MLHERIKNDIHAAFRARESRKTSLLKTLFSDATTAARAKENRMPTDDEMVKIIRKYVGNAEIMVEACKKNGRDPADSLEEIAILSTYLPAEVTDAETRSFLDVLKASGHLPAGPAATGAAMKALKEHFAERFDGKLMTPVVKSVLAG